MKICYNVTKLDLQSKGTNDKEGNKGQTAISSSDRLNVQGISEEDIQLTKIYILYKCAKTQINRITVTLERKQSQ